MENLIIKESKGTPFINFSSETGQLQISGASYPEDSHEFYVPIIEWIENFSQTYEGRVSLNVSLSYFNTSSSKAILDIFDILEERHISGKESGINWFYRSDRENIKESGEEFAEDLKIAFNLISFDNK